MKITDQATWDLYRQSNTDGYGKGIIDFAERWADKMEAHMAQGETLEQCAEKAEREADLDGITGFMYGAAVQTLVHTWEHAETLRTWHNRQYGVADDQQGVVNPAILTISMPENTEDKGE